MIPRIIMSIALAVAFAGPAVAQSYSASYGTGNVIDVPLPEKQTAAMAMAEQVLHGRATRLRLTPCKAEAAFQLMPIPRQRAARSIVTGAIAADGAPVRNPASCVAASRRPD